MLTVARTIVCQESKVTNYRRGIRGDQTKRDQPSLRSKTAQMNGSVFFMAGGRVTDRSSYAVMPYGSTTCETQLCFVIANGGSLAHPMVVLIFLFGTSSDFESSGAGLNAGGSSEGGRPVDRPDLP